MPRIPDPFEPAVCQRLRKIRARYLNAVEKKKGAEETRDALDEQIAGCAKDQKNKLRDLKADWADAVHAIKRFARLKKACVNALLETIEKGDDKQLWPGGIDDSPTDLSLLAMLDDVSHGEEDEAADEKQKAEPVPAAA